MKRLGTLTAIVLVTIGLVVAGGIAGASTRAATSDKPTATDIGVSATEIRIAVIADVDNPFAPGLFQGSVDAVNGAAKTINQQGGIGGRKVVVDFIDSHLNPNESRNAVITACQNDFAMVGGASLFLTSVDDEINCKDKAGNNIGLPDIGGIVTGIPQQCSPVSFPANPPQILCDTKAQSPQTYQGQQGAAKYFLKKINKNLKGPNILPNDTKDAFRGDKVQALINIQAGIKQTQEVTHSGKDPQSAYTSVVQQMKSDGSNFVFDGLAYANMIELQQEAAAAERRPVVTWQCTTACYDPKYIKDGGSSVGGHVHVDRLPAVRRGQHQPGHEDDGQERGGRQGHRSRPLLLHRRHGVPAGDEGRRRQERRERRHPAEPARRPEEAHQLRRRRHHRRGRHRQQEDVAVLRAHPGEERQVRAGVALEEGHASTARSRTTPPSRVT